MKKLLFLYNTHAGKGLLKSRLAAVQDALAADWDVTIHPTRGAGDATAVAAARAGEFDRIVCSGGDGTLHEVVAGLMGLENRPEVGYIPAGTTNDFAKNLSLPRGMEAMARVAAAGVPRPVDIGSFNDRYFIYVAAFGAFTDVAYSTPQPVKNIFGHLAYVLEGATRLGSIQAYPLTVEHDGGVEEGGFCYGMVSNTVSVGGFKGMPAEPVRLDDGLFEVVLVRQPQNPLQLQAVIKALLTMSPDEGGLVTSFRTSRLRVACGQELPWTLDGEFGGAPAVAEIVNRQKAVTNVYGKSGRPLRPPGWAGDSGGVRGLRAGAGTRPYGSALMKELVQKCRGGPCGRPAGLGTLAECGCRGRGQAPPLRVCGKGSISRKM